MSNSAAPEDPRLVFVGAVPWLSPDADRRRREREVKQSAVM